MKAVLEDHGIFENKIGSPRSVIKIAYQCGMINDCEAWIDLLDSRNILAHTYSNEQALEVIKKVKSGYMDLFWKLKLELDERWM